MRKLTGTPCPLLKPNFAYRYVKEMGFPGGSVVKSLAANVRRRRRHGFDPWLGKISWRRRGQYSCLERPMDRGALWATAPGIAKELNMTNTPNSNSNSAGWGAGPHHPFS